MKKKKKIFLVIVLIILILLGTFFGIRIIKTNNFKKNINHVNEKLVKAQDNFINNQKIFSTPLSITSNITKEGVLDENITLNAKFDFINNISEFSLNPSILELTSPIEFYIHNSRKFITSKDILSRMYEISIDTTSISCDSTLECNTFPKTLNSINTNYPKDKIIDLLDEIKKLINNSISLFDIKENSLKNNIYNKVYIYNINNKTLKRIKKNFNKDNDLKNNLYTLFQDYFDKYNLTADDIDKIFDNNITGSIKVYMDNKGNIKYEIILDNMFNISLEENNNKDTYNISFLNDFNLVISLDYSNNKFSLIGTKDKLEVINLELDSKDILNLNGKIILNDKEYDVVSTDDIISQDDNNRVGTLKIRLNDSNYIINYNLEYLVILEKSLVDNYANYTELTKEDLTNIELNLIKLTKSNILNDIFN